MTTSTNTVDLSQIRRGARVLGPAGERIGEVHPQSSLFGSNDKNYLYVEKKSIIYGSRYLYIPFSAIAGLRNGAVVLNASPAEIPDHAWERAPETA